jgi:hypothetical protein
MHSQQSKKNSKHITDKTTNNTKQITTQKISHSLDVIIDQTDGCRHNFFFFVWQSGSLYLRSDGSKGNSK